MLNGTYGILTGGTSTLGREILSRLIDYDSKVIFTYYHNQQLAHELEEKYKGKVYPIKLNLLDPDEINKTFDLIENKFGNVTYLINNAGKGTCLPTEQLPLEIWNETMALNLTAPFLCAQKMIKIYKELKGGRIINISSVAGLTGGSFGAHYGATKAGIIGLTKSLARDYGKYGIVANAVAPGPIESEMTSTLSKEIMDGILDATPLRRLGNASEVAELVCQLLNPNMNYMNGQTLVIDGGRYMV